MKATAKDLRLSSKELLATVSRGEEVVITHRGKPVAKLVPLASGVPQPSTELEMYGIWADYTPSENVNAYVRQLRKPRYTRAD
ncbi:type II toxin-antitoxin system Phd/YefM family antitoxin [Nitrospira sp. M1]